MEKFLISIWEFSRMNMESSRPNIILVTAHDTGEHLGCYGYNDVDTPNLDRIAEEGIIFKNYFATAPQCSPSRGSIITGRYPHTNGLMGLVNMGMNGAGLDWSLPDKEETTASGKISKDFVGNYNLTYKEKKTYNKGKTINIDKPIAGYNARLVDIINDKTVWISELHGGGNAFATQMSLYKSVCDDILEDLEKNGFLIKKENNSYQ